MFGDDVWRGGAAAEAVKLAELARGARVRLAADLRELPEPPSALLRQYPVSKDFETVTGLTPDLIFLVGCQGVHGNVNEPIIIQIGPNPVLMGRHYPLDIAAQCEVKGTLAGADRGAAPRERLRASRRVGEAARRRCRAYAKTLIEREEKLVREHEHDSVIHPVVLEASSPRRSRKTASWFTRAPPRARR